MKTLYKSFLLVAPLLVLFAISLLQLRCSPQQPAKMTHDQMVQHGKYLVAIMGCNDCHSPKIFTAQGPIVDSTHLLSGSPSSMPLPKMDTNSLHPGYWVLFTPDLTAAAGPWGISFSANITPDSTTGIGGWDEGKFIRAMRTGKHRGFAGERDILPPMPWQDFSHSTDDDLKSIFAYLQSIPAMHNPVHGPIPPPDVKKM